MKQNTFTSYSKTKYDFNLNVKRNHSLNKCNPWVNITKILSFTRAQQPTVALIDRLPECNFQGL